MNRVRRRLCDAFSALVQLPGWHWWSFLIAAVVGPRLVWIAAMPAQLFSDFATYDELAERLAAGLGYSTSHGSPTAYWPIGYPFFLAIVYRLAGHHLLFVKLAQTGLAVVTVLGAYLLALPFSRAAARVASLVVALWPSLVGMTDLLASENLFLPLFVLEVFLFGRLTQDEPPFHPLAAGFLTGCAALVRPTGLGVVACAIAVLAFRRQDWARRCARVVLACAGAGVVVFAWSARNSALLGTPVLISTNAGENLWIGNHHGATGGYTEPLALYDALRGMSEVAKNTEAREMAVRFIRDEPTKVVGLLPRKLWHFAARDTVTVGWMHFDRPAAPRPLWLKYTLAAVAQAYYLMALVFASYGVASGALRWPEGRWIALVCTYYVGVHLVFFGDPRFHLPLLPLLGVFSAFGALAWAQNKAPVPSHSRLKRQLLRRGKAQGPTLPVGGKAMKHLVPVPKPSFSWRSVVAGRPLLRSLAWVRPRGYLANCWSRLRQLERSQWLAPEGVTELQLAAVQRVLRHAGQCSPHYRALFRRIGVDPEDIRSLDALRAIPVLSRVQLQEDWREILTCPVDSPGLIRNASGGSSGEPVVFYQDREELWWRSAAALRHDQWAGWHMGEKTAAIWGAARDFGIHSGDRSWVNRLIFPQLLIDATRLDEGSMAAGLARLGRWQPKLIVGYSNALYVLALFAGERGHNIHPAGIIATAEVLTDERRRVIEEVFACPVYDRYGAREFGLLASQCEYRGGLHINAEKVLLEFDHTRADEAGRAPILITDLHNLAMPLIRYEIGDLGKPLPGRCTCGRGLPLMDRVAGRVTEFIVTPSGTRVSGVSVATYLITNCPGLRQVQIVQAEPGRVVLRCVAGKDFREETRLLLAERGREFFGEQMAVEIEEVEAIPRSPSGKWLFSTSLVAADGSDLK